MNFRNALRICLKLKKCIIAFLLPIVLLPIVIYGKSLVANCAYAVIIVGVYWVTELMPIAISSLIPIVLFPLLGIMTAEEVCSSYANDTLMLFMGSLIVAAAVERWGLHKRIALRALTLVGPEPRWMMLGIMLPTWFLSMWMSNTATTAMMIPILNAILVEIKHIKEKVRKDKLEDATKIALLIDNKDKFIMEDQQEVSSEASEESFMEPGFPLSIHKERKRSCPSDANIKRKKLKKIARKHFQETDDSPSALANLTEGEGKGEPLLSQSDEEFRDIAKTFALCVAYASNSGGIATLTGTPPNIILKSQADILYHHYNLPTAITFANWLLVAFPLSFIIFIVTWVWLQIYSMGRNCLCCIKTKEDYNVVKTHLLNQYSRLGKWSFAEKIVLADFVILGLLWVMRDPVFMPGWGTLLQNSYVQDSTSAIFMSVILFILPSHIPHAKATKKSENPNEEAASFDYVPLLSWDYFNHQMAWRVFLLMGGGFALADGCLKSGLSDWMSNQLTVFAGLQPWIIAAILSFFTAAITNVASNAATATLFLPIVGSLAIRLEIHPLYFMIPCALSASFAYLLPVGTPSNAIVFSTGYLKTSDMIKAGIVVNILTVLLTCFALNTFFSPVFNFSNIPKEFLPSNTSNVRDALLMLNETLVGNT